MEREQLSEIMTAAGLFDVLHQNTGILRVTTVTTLNPICLCFLCQDNGNIEGADSSEISKTNY